MKRMHDIEAITIHGFDTPADMDVTPEDLHQWHVVENGWDDVGYHWWIDRQGKVHQGRSDRYQGAHVGGHNPNNLGVGMAGGKPDFNYTQKQLTAMTRLVSMYRTRYPNAKVGGHRDWGETGKTCPGFDVRAYLQLDDSEAIK